MTKLPHLANSAFHAWTAAIAAAVSLAALCLTPMLYSLGMFCFDGDLLGLRAGTRPQAPDCFVAGVSGWIDPRLWLWGALAGAGLLCGWAFVSAFGLARRRTWARLIALSGACYGAFYCAALALSLEEFRTVGWEGAATLATLLVMLTFAPRPQPRNLA